MELKNLKKIVETIKNITYNLLSLSIVTCALSHWFDYKILNIIHILISFLTIVMFLIFLGTKIKFKKWT